MQNIVLLFIILLLSIVLFFPLHVLADRLLGFLKNKNVFHMGFMLALPIGNLVVQYFVWTLVLTHYYNNLLTLIEILLYTVIVYNSFAIIYLFFVLTPTETSIRLRVLLEILLSGGNLSRDAIKKEYSLEVMTNVRLERLIAGKQLQKKDNRYFIRGRSLLLLSKLMILWEKLLGVSPI